MCGEILLTSPDETSAGEHTRAKNIAVHVRQDLFDAGLNGLGRPGSALDTLKSPLVRRFGQARRLTAPPCVLLLDGPRNPQSSTAIRMALEPRLIA